MQKKHLVGYPIVTLTAFAIGAAGSASTPTPSGAAPAPTVSVTSPAEPAPTVTVTAAPTSPTQIAGATPAPPAAIPGDGTYEVGVDIQPGKYASDTPTSGNCYWARLKNDDPFDGILANNNSSGKSVVVIKKSDKYFQSSGCSDWTKR
ncbi:hypothetical protein [Mobilicoccus sp.]|uniref:hypothetical protein n=1 Tax=Mobilicoccus sp. TaxID=2034349 RepID=UPI0028A17D4C|nr:hypothetical protein [Mobilicoccus sp.]